MLIKSIEIQNFRRFEHYHCEFDPRFTLLVGPNGAGKTSMLNAVIKGLSVITTHAGASSHLLDADVRRVRAVDVSNSSWLHPIHPCRITESVVLEGQMMQVGTDLKGPASGGVGQWVDFGPTGGRTPSTFAALKRSVSTWFDPVRVEAIPLLAQIGASDSLQGAAIPNLVSQVFATKQDVWALAKQATVDVERLAQWFQHNELRTLQEGVAPVTYRVAKAAVLSAIHAQDIKYIVRDNQLMVLHDDQGWRPFDQLSDGQRRVAAIFCELALRCASLNSHLGERCVAETPGVVTIDELDLHLHPQWQRSIIGDLCRVFPKLQFIAASHSPFLLQAAYEYGQVLDVATGQFVNPTDQSIEDIAESVMGVPQPQRGQRFLKLKERAQEFYDLLESKPADPEAAATLKQKLDESLAVFADDPAAAAWLEQRRLAAGH